MRIRTTLQSPPIPDRRFDWSAVDEDTYAGPGSPIGTGATEADAVADLLEQMEARGAPKADLALGLAAWIVRPPQ